MMDRPFSSNAEDASDRAANNGFTLIALHSADRMTRSLSPWTRQMLGDEPGLGMARHTVLNRVLRRRSRGSSSFLSTLSILRRFHRIVTRSTAWKVGVGSVDPNLFDRFVSDLIKRQRMGANNIPSLISLGEQRRREMDMPLAGAIGEISPTPASDSISASSMASQMGFGAPSAAPTSAPADNKPLTMEEIKRRIEEAKRFKSNTPGSVPDFVRATQQPKSDTSAAPPAAPSLPPGFPPMPGQPVPPNVTQRMPMSPTPSTPRPPEALNPPSAQPNAQTGAEQRVPPRLRRRRFASVEYVSLPNMEDDEGGDKDEPSSQWRFATGPPGDLVDELSQWIEPFANVDAPVSTAARDLGKTRPRSAASQAVAPSLAASVRPRRATIRSARRMDRSATNDSNRGRLSRKPARQLIGLGDPLPQSDASIAQRPLARLAGTLSGQMLASRPHHLLAQVLRKETVYPTIDPDITAKAPAERVSFVPAARPAATLEEIRLQSAVRRANDSGLRLSPSRWLAISPDDFTLTPPFPSRVRRPTTDDSPAVDDPLSGAIPTQWPPRPSRSPLQRSISQRSLSPRSPSQPISVAPALLAAPTAAVPASESFVQRSAQPIQRFDRRVQHSRRAAPTVYPRARDGGRALAQLQVAPPPTLSILATQEPLVLSAGSVERLTLPEPALSPLIGVAVQRSALPSAPRPYPVRSMDREVRPQPSPLKLPAPVIAQTQWDVDLVARRMVGAISRQVSGHTQAVTGKSPINRPFHHLAEALSGEILASRPQVLMAQILAPDERRIDSPATLLPMQRSPLAGQRIAPTLSAVSGDKQSSALVEIAGWGLRPGSAQSPLGARSTAPRLPISVDDFVLPPVRRILATERSGPDLPDGVAREDVAAGSMAIVQRGVSSVPGNEGAVNRPARHRRLIERPQPLPKGQARDEAKRPHRALAQLQAAPLTRSVVSDERQRLSPVTAVSPTQLAPFEPVSALWRQAQIAQAVAAGSPRHEDAPLSPFVSVESQPVRRAWLGGPSLPPMTSIPPVVDRVPRVPRATAQTIPLELSMRRLLGSRAISAEEAHPEQPLPSVRGRTLPLAQPIAPAPTVSSTPSPMTPVQTQRRRPRRVDDRPSPSGERPVADRSEPQAGGRATHPAPQTPTLMERVLHRDFAGARVQTVAVSSRGVEAAPPAQSLSVLARELIQKSPHRETQHGSPPALPLILSTHAVQPARMPSPVQSPTPTVVSTKSVASRLGSPLASPTRPHLTRQLSQRIVQLSQARQEPSAQAVESALVEMASSARRTHRFAPASHAWKAHPSASSRLVMPSQDLSPSTPTQDDPRAERPASSVRRTLPLRQGPIQRADPVAGALIAPMPGVTESRTSQADTFDADTFDADTVRSLLKPGTLSIETLSDSSLLQRPAPALGALPLTDFVLARVGAGQRMRTSQPAVTSSPLEALPPPPSPLRPAQSYSTAQRAASPSLRRAPEVSPASSSVAAPGTAAQPVTARPRSQQAILRRMPVVTPRGDTTLPNLDRRRAVQTMAERSQRYERMESVSQLWRPHLLSAPAPVTQRVDAHPAPSTVKRVQTHRVLSAPGDLLAQQPTQRQPLARLVAAQQPLPLLPSPRTADRPSVRRAGIEVTNAEQVAAAVTSLMPRRRAERVVHLETAREYPMRSIRTASDQPIAEIDGEVRPEQTLVRTPRSDSIRNADVEMPLTPPLVMRSIRTANGEPLHDANVDLSAAPPTRPARPARRIRRQEADESARSTLLERVAARDFADLRSERLAEGPLLLPLRRTATSTVTPSSVRESAASTTPRSAASTVRSTPSFSVHQLSKELVLRSGLSAYPNLGSPPVRLHLPGLDFDPVSMAWPRMDWRRTGDERTSDHLSPPAYREGAPIQRRAAAAFIPLELAMQRLLGSHAASDSVSAPEIASDGSHLPAPTRQGVGRVSAAAVAPMVAQMERQGWRFKRAERAPKVGVGDVQRSVESLGRQRSRPLAQPVRTLMERVLGRDFAGVRVQTASMTPLGVEAATRGDTVFLSEGASRLDRPQSLGVLAHELTHVAARSPRARPSEPPLTHLQQSGSAVQRQSTPLMLSPRRVSPAVNQPAFQDQPGPSPEGRAMLPGLPVPSALPLPALRRSATTARVRRSPAPTSSPLRPHLTRQLSQRLVQMSLAQEERTAEEVEAAVARLASSAQVARRFAPASHLWRTPLFAEGPHMVEADDPARVIAPLPVTQPDRSPLASGRGRLSTLPTLDLSARSVAPGRTPADDVAMGSAPNFLQRDTDSVSLTGERSVARVTPSQRRPLAPLIQPERTVAALEREGWRFKRADRPRLVAPDRIQRAVAQLQQRSDRGMPLPRQPRTLMERVLQRDFSKVRVQTAPLQTLGVEAAARENTVYLAREQANRLDRAENLALLGHELTHVAASGNAPVQRSTAPAEDLPVVQRHQLDEREVQRTPHPPPAMPLRPLLPATIQRSLAGEESLAAGVEEGLRAFLRQSSQSVDAETQPSNAPVNRSSLPVIQRTPLVARTTSRPSGEARIQRLTAVDERDSALPRLGVSPVQLKRFRSGEPILAGVPSLSMDVAPRTPIIRRMPAQAEPGFVERSENPPMSTPTTSPSPASAPLVQREPNKQGSTTSTTSTSSTSSTQGSSQKQLSDPTLEQEAEWNRLAEKVYPLIRRMLMIERERRPL